MKRLKRLALFLLICISPAANYSTAQDTSDTDPEMPGIQQPVAPVKIDKHVLFNVRGLSSYTAEQRASAISRRIREAASDESVSRDSIRIVPESDFSSIYAGERFIMNVYDSDADLEKVKRETLARHFSQKTAEALDIYRNDRSRPVLFRKSVTALGSLAILILVVLLLRWLINRIDSAIQNRIRKRIDTVENKSFSLIQADQLWKAYYAIFRIGRIIALVLLIAAYLNYLLGLFPWTSNVAAYVLKLIIDPLTSFGSSILNFLPSLVFLIIIYLVARYILKLSKLLFRGIQQGGIEIKGFDPDWATPTFRIFRILVIAFAIIVAYPYIPGSESNAFKGISVFIGVLFSLGSSSFISNLIAGYSMTYRRAFKKGDRIQVGDHTGIVEEQEILVTRLRSLKNEEVIIPNSILLNSSITNYSTMARESRLILHTCVGIGYETPWRLVDKMLRQAADRTEGLLKDPPPYVLKLALGDFAVTYEINAFCNDTSRIPLYYTALHQNILDVFNENNIQIMTPAYEGDPEIPKVVPKDQWNTPLAADIQS